MKGGEAMIENFEGVGPRIQQLMDNLVMKQVDIVRETGISKNALSNYINGNRIPDNKALYTLSKFFNVSMEWILTGENTCFCDSKSFASSELNTLLSSDEIELLSLYRNLTEDGKLEMRMCARVKNEIIKKKTKKGSLSDLVNGEEAAAKINA